MNLYFVLVILREFLEFLVKKILEVKFDVNLKLMIFLNLNWSKVKLIYVIVL